MSRRPGLSIAEPFLLVFLLAVSALALFLPAWTAAPPVGQTLKLPIGTLLPVSVENELSSKKLVKDQNLEARITQDVPLPGKEKVPAGSKLLGSVVDVPYMEDGPSSITFRFTSLEIKRAGTIPIVVALRAMTTFTAARDAQISNQENGPGSPGSWASTMQIGGDMRYGDGGKVTDRHNHKIGKATTNGGVLARPQDSPGSPCAGWPDATQAPQALWVFSANACGLYDMKNVRLSHAGNKEPLGEITLSRDQGEIKLMKSSALLLRVVK